VKGKLPSSVINQDVGSQSIISAGNKDSDDEDDNGDPDDEPLNKSDDDDDDTVSTKRYSFVLLYSLGPCISRIHVVFVVLMCGCYYKILSKILSYFVSY